MPGLLSDCALETGTISGSLSLPDVPEEQCGLSSMDAPGPAQAGPSGSSLDSQTRRPRAAVSASFFTRKRRKKKSLYASVSPSSDWEDSLGGVRGNGWKILT